MLAVSPAVAETPAVVDVYEPVLTTDAGFVYGYEGWKELKSVQSKSSDGVTITGPAAGGAGIILKPAADLSQATQLVVQIKAGPGNTAKSGILKIVGGKEWKIDLSALSAETFATLKLPFNADGKTPAGDKYKAVQNVQFQGDFNPTTVVDVTFGSIVATGPDKAK